MTTVSKLFSRNFSFYSILTKYLLKIGLHGSFGNIWNAILSLPEVNFDKFSWNHLTNPENVLLAGKKIREMFQVTRWMQNRRNYKTWNPKKFNFKIFRESRLSYEHGRQFFVKLNKSYLFRLHCKSGILRVVFSWNHF